VVLIKMEIDLLPEAMIVPVKYGKLKLEIFCIHYKGIKMQYIQWHLMYLLGISLFI
jgi:hypothetical protein